MAPARGKRFFYLTLSLVLLCGYLMACGSQEGSKEAAKEKGPPPAAPATGVSAPKTAADYVNHGKEVLKSKQYDQAIASFSEAVKLDPKAIPAYNNRGIAYCEKGNFDQAIAEFSRVIEIDPRHGKAYNNRAVAYMMKGEKDKARQDVLKAQSLGIAVNQMLIDSLKPAEAKGEAASGKAPAPGKPETKGKGEAKKK
jgi:tetratricopeptide (TPR) repeat protein